MLEKQQYLTTQGFLALDKAEQSKKGKERLRTLWRLASDGWRLKRVSMARWKKAIELHKAIKHEWKLTKLALEFGNSASTHGTPMHNRVLKDLKAAHGDCKKLCKELGLRLYMGTFAHIFDSREGQIL